MSTDNTHTPEPHIFLFPHVNYQLSKHPHEGVSYMTPTEDAWKKTRTSCNTCVEVPLSRHWKSALETSGIPSKDVQGICYRSHTGPKTEHATIESLCRADLYKEVEHQLKYVQPPESSCFASTGRHVVGILSENLKNTVGKTRDDDFWICGWSGPSDIKPLQDSCNNPFEGRELTHELWQDEDKNQFVRCSFADTWEGVDPSLTQIPPGMKTAEGVKNHRKFPKPSRNDEGDIWNQAASVYKYVPSDI